MAKDKVLSIKVPIGLYDRMVREVELGEYTNVSDLTKVAIRLHLQQLQDTRVGGGDGQKIMKERTYGSIGFERDEVR